MGSPATALSFDAQGNPIQQGGGTPPPSFDAQGNPVQPKPAPLPALTPVPAHAPTGITPVPAGQTPATANAAQPLSLADQATQFLRNHVTSSSGFLKEGTTARPAAGAPAPPFRRASSRRPSTASA